MKIATLSLTLAVLSPVLAAPQQNGLAPKPKNYQQVPDSRLFLLTKAKTTAIGSDNALPATAPIETPATSTETPKARLGDRRRGKRAAKPLEPRMAGPGAERSGRSTAKSVIKPTPGPTAKLTLAAIVTPPNIPGLTTISPGLPTPFQSIDPESLTLLIASEAVATFSASYNTPSLDRRAKTLVPREDSINDEQSAVFDDEEHMEEGKRASTDTSDDESDSADSGNECKNGEGMHKRTPSLHQDQDVDASKSERRWCGSGRNHTSKDEVAQTITISEKQTDICRSKNRSDSVDPHNDGKPSPKPLCDLSKFLLGRPFKTPHFMRKKKPAEPQGD
jgi:hypothetical protein